MTAEEYVQHQIGRRIIGSSAQIVMSYLKECSILDHSEVCAASFAYLRHETRRLFTASIDGEIREWDLHSKTLIRTIGPTNHYYAIKLVSIHPSGSSVAVAYTNGKVACMRSTLVDGQPRWSLFMTMTPRERSLVRSISFSPNGQRIAVVWESNIARASNFGPNSAYFERFIRLSSDQKCFEPVAFSAHEKILVATLDKDFTLRVWNVCDRTCISVCKGSRRNIRAISFGNQGKRMASVSDSGTVRIWSIPSGRCLSTISGVATGCIDSIVMSPDGRKVATSSVTDCTVRVWDAEWGTCLESFQCMKGPKRVAFHPSGTHMVCFPRYSKIKTPTSSFVLSDAMVCV